MAKAPDGKTAMTISLRLLRRGKTVEEALRADHDLEEVEADGVKALNEPDLIAAAKADLKKRTARTPYVSPLPDNVAPPLDMSLS